MVTDLIKTAIRRNIENRDSFDMAYLGNLHYFRELATVRLSLGRRMGHTTAIKELAKPWDLVISNSIAMLDNIGINNWIERYSVNQLDSSFRGKFVRCKTIWVDNFSYCANMRHATETEFSGMLYNMFGVDEEQTFVFLG